MVEKVETKDTGDCEDCRARKIFEKDAENQAGRARLLANHGPEALKELDAAIKRRMEGY